MSKAKTETKMDSFQSWAHRWGRVGTLIALIYMVALPFVVLAAYDTLSAAERSTLLHSFLPKGSRIRKPLSIPTLIRIITTPNCRPVALSSISAEDA